MFETALIVLCIGMVISLVALIYVAQPLTQDFRRAGSQPSTQPQQLPPAAVILCIRGADPTLPLCLEGLLNQNYPDYQIHIVLDHHNDPGRPAVQAAADRSDKIYLHVLDAPDQQSNRGLKVSSILQAINSLDKDRQVIAFIDADAVPQPDWLSSLAAPLLDPAIGATSGIRWYRPDSWNPGSLVRARWNLYAVALMRFAGMPWGGSLALRRDTLTQCDLLTKWSTCLCEDSCLGDELRTRNLRVEYVPNVSMVNDETTTLAACVRFISRQLVMTRLHADHWLTFVILGTIIPVMAIISFVFLGCTLMFEEWSRILLSMVIVEGYHIAVTIFERRMESLLDHVPVNSNAAQHNGWRPAKVLQVYVAQLLSIPVTLLAFIMAASARQVTWRGVTYEFNGRAQIQMQKYEPFQPMAEDTPVLQKVSI